MEYGPHMKFALYYISVLLSFNTRWRYCFEGSFFSKDYSFFQLFSPGLKREGRRKDKMKEDIKEKALRKKEKTKR